MIVGVPKETAAGERRVALVPDAAGKLVKAGFEVRVEVTTEDQVVTVTLPRSEFLELGLDTDAEVAVHEASAARLHAHSP